MKHPRFEISTDARLLMQAMADTEVGDVVTYDTLSSIISKPVAAAYQPLRTALRRLLKDKDMVFGCVTGVGFKRLNDAEIVAEGEHAAARIRRQARRAVERQMKADFSKLSNEQKRRFTAQVSIMATVAFMTRETRIAKLADQVKPAPAAIPVAKTLALFTRKPSTEEARV